MISTYVWTQSFPMPARYTYIAIRMATDHGPWLQPILLTTAMTTFSRPQSHTGLLQTPFVACYVASVPAREPCVRTLAKQPVSLLLYPSLSSSVFVSLTPYGSKATCWGRLRQSRWRLYRSGTKTLAVKAQDGRGRPAFASRRKQDWTRR